MILFNFPISQPSSNQMRIAAQNVGVSWDETTIIYDAGAVGYADAPSDADPTPIQDELETLIGIRPSVVDDPE